MTLDLKLQLWNTIGTWIAGIATLLAVLVSLRLALRGEAVQRHAERRRNAAELYALFASAELERARADAAAFLRANNAQASPLSFQQMHSECTTGTLTAVTRVIQFWERAAIFVETNYVDDELTRRFLRHFFESHCQNYLVAFSVLCRARPDDGPYLQWTYALERLASIWGIRLSDSSKT